MTPKPPKLSPHGQQVVAAMTATNGANGRTSTNGKRSTPASDAAEGWLALADPDDDIERRRCDSPRLILPNGNGHRAHHEPERLRDSLLSLADLATIAAAEPLVDGLLYRNTLAQLSGPPGSYKSFVAVGLACAVATGQTWIGHRVPRREKVVYAAAEGASGLRARILAWCELTRVDPDDLDGWLYVLPTPIQLGYAGQVDLAAEMVADLRPGLLVLDTRARCTLGLEENSATEQGKAIAAAERIREAAGCTVLAIHHTGRTGTTPRGSTAWDGAVWTDLRLKSEYLSMSLEVEKHKDAPSGEVYSYTLAQHTVTETLMPGIAEDARKSLVVFSRTRENPGEILTALENRVREIAEKTCGPEGLTRRQLVDVCVESGVSQAGAYRSINALVKAGHLHNIGTGSRWLYVYSGPTGDTEETP